MFIKPCPICGKKVTLFKDDHKKYGVLCVKCNLFFGIKLENGCELIEGWKALFDTDTAAVNEWNKRC